MLVENALRPVTFLIASCVFGWSACCMTVHSGKSETRIERIWLVWMKLRQRWAADTAEDRSSGQETRSSVHTLLFQVGFCVAHSCVLRVLASEFYWTSFWDRDEIGGASLLISQRRYLWESKNVRKAFWVGVTIDQNTKTQEIQKHLWYRKSDFQIFIEITCRELGALFSWRAET